MSRKHCLTILDGLRRECPEDEAKGIEAAIAAISDENNWKDAPTRCDDEVCSAHDLAPMHCDNGYDTPAGRVPTLNGLKKAVEAKTGKRWTVLVAETINHELTVEAADEDEANEKAEQYMHDDEVEGVEAEEVGRDHDIHSTEETN